MFRPGVFLRAACGAAVVVLACPTLTQAMQPGRVTPAKAESVTVVAGARYRASALHRWLAGDAYRDLWVRPIRVPVLDWQTYAGGLHPTKEGGGMQTKSLRFEAADGSQYVFRLSDKSVGSAPEVVKSTPVGSIARDVISAMHPAGAPVAAPIVEASGGLHPTAVLMVLPDDAALGKYRAQYAGRLGMLEEYPNVPEDAPGFGGASKIIDSEDLLKRLNADAWQTVDARAFLTARLTDFLINDNDRHPGNWKWARLDSGSRTAWQPIARDRDHAFVSYEGVLMRIARLVKPSVVLFGPRPSVPGLTRIAGFDARILAGLEKPVWDSVVRALQARITDSVLVTAAHTMPIEYQPTAPRLIAVLEQRRAALTTSADQFYHRLAARVEVHATDSADRAVITRAGDRFVDVRLESRGPASFSRRFDARETSEILVYLHGGDDSALITGRAGGGQSILVRVIGGNGTNTLVDSSTIGGNAHPTRLYDAGIVRGVSYGEDTLFSRRPWEIVNVVLVPPLRDEGSSFAPVAGLGFHSTIGITPRLGVVRYTYGFGKRPYASMMKMEGEYATRVHGVRLALDGDKRLESSPWHFTGMAEISDLEVVSFYGFGNATIDSGSTSSYFDVHQRQWALQPAIAFAVDSRLDLALGPTIRHSTIDAARSPFVSATRPYGFGTFDQAGVQFSARYKWRAASGDSASMPHRVQAELTGMYVPAVLDARSAFASATIRAWSSTTLPLPTQPVLVIRAGGKRLSGDFPFYEAAFIGGDGTTRYMQTQRYAGDASLYGTSELRIPVARFKLVVPLRVGIVGVAEAGRVYNNGRSPGGWYTQAGEGVWLGCCGVQHVLTLTHTTGKDNGGLHLRFGLNF